MRGAALTSSGARLAAGGPLGGSPDVGCAPRKPASSSSSRNPLQKLHEKLLERMCSPPLATQRSGFMQNTRMFPYWRKHSWKRWWESSPGEVQWCRRDYKPIRKPISRTQNILFQMATYSCTQSKQPELIILQQNPAFLCSHYTTVQCYIWRN